MRRIFILLVSVFTVLTLSAGPALAAVLQGPFNATSTHRSGGLHFVGLPQIQLEGSYSTSVQLTSFGNVAGAGPGAFATLTADLETVTGCINPSNQDPGQQPKGLRTSNSTESGTADIPSTEGGSTPFSVSTPLVSLAQPVRNCPGKADMEPVVVSMTYTDITLTVTSANKTATADFNDIQVYPVPPA